MITISILFGDLIAPKSRIININNFHFCRAKTPSVDQNRTIFTCFKNKIKNISYRIFQLKMIPLNAQRFNLFKYMWFCPTKIFCDLTGGRKVGPRMRVGSGLKRKIQKLELPLTIILFCIICINYIDMNIDIASVSP